jgi:large subunit ribosomal protein L5
MIIKDQNKKTFDTLKGEFSYKNTMQTPTIEKVVVSVGIGKIGDKKAIEKITNDLTRITGQKPSEIAAKKSIAAFKLREGQAAGLKVTLRGEKMWNFLEKLVHVALPRTRDFRGIGTNMDEMGNYTLGIKENSIFPETADVDLRDVFGMGIVITTNSSNPEETRAYLKHLGFPFKKEA